MTICDCCERPVPYVRGSPWHGEHRLCLACFFVWYEGGGPKPDEIKAEVLAAEATGVFPFTSDDPRLRRASRVTTMIALAP